MSDRRDNYEDSKVDKDFSEIKLENIKNFVDVQLEKLGLYDKIKNIVNDVDDVDEEKILSKIKEAGIIDQVLDNLKSSSDSKPLSEMSRENKKCLYLKLNSGKGFIDYVKNTDESDYFQFDILFFGQRFQSKKIYASSEFRIDQSFLLDFNPLKLEVDVNINLLKKISSPIHVVLLSCKDENERALIATKSIEWRWALCYGSWKIEAEMYSPSTMNKLNVGIIDMQISLLPFVDKNNLVPERIIFEQLNDEKKSETEKAQDFIKYANDWWEDYKTIRNSHSTRIIKLFLPTEDRENYVYKPANCLIEPICVGRAINTPYEAARFVSLIPFERRENPGGDKIELWQSAHTFLSLLKGDVEDHSTLLCNLLLGFGLDAYIAIGLSINGPHVWVVTRSKLENKKYTTSFWESLTGQRINIDDPKVFRFYKKIHCVFNDSKFYANIQIDDTVFNTIYNFEDEFLWKNIPSDKISYLTKYSFTPILDVCEIDKYKLESDIEREVKSKILKFRKTMDMKTTWDSKLSYLISPALVNYEFERISNLTYGNEEFKQSVKNYVPEGYVFKGFPLQTIDKDSDKIFASILSSEVGKDILYSRGDQVSFAIRCKVCQYPQNVNSIWVMIAVKYRPIK